MLDVPAETEWSAAVAIVVANPIADPYDDKRGGIHPPRVFVIPVLDLSFLKENEVHDRP
jgi:hypothetical protein